MIREARPADEAPVLATARAAPAMGARLWVNWQLWQKNPAMPYRFYLAGGAVLEHTGGWLTVLGPVEDAGELAAFVDFLGVDQVMGWVPPGWREESGCVMAWTGTPAEEAPPPGFDDAPPVEEVLAVLESTAPMPQPQRDNLYADLCARRSRGYAALYGVRGEGGALLSVAGAACITPWEVYLSGVETRPQARGRGLATALVRQVCRRHAPRRVSLICDPPLVPYYEKLGFGRCPPVAAGYRPGPKETP